MSRIDYKANFAQELKDERERLITAIKDEIAKAAKTDADVSSEIKTEFSGDVLRNNILLVVALGESQYFWLCYWRDGHGGAYAYDEDDFPKLRDCNRYADDKEVAKIVGLSDSRFLYTEKVERGWIINTTYSKAAAKPIASNLVQMHKQLNTSRSYRELSDIDRQILEYIYRAFKNEGRWVRSRHLVHDLQALGGDVYEIAKGIGWWLVRVEDPDSREDALAKLTIEGVAACEGSEQDLLDFVSVLQLFVRTYRATRDSAPQVTTDDFVRELNLSELQARKMAMLVLEEGGLYPNASDSGTGHARFRLDRKILRVEKVDSIEDYLEIREQDRAQRLAASKSSLSAIEDVGQVIDLTPSEISSVPATPASELATTDEIRVSLNRLRFLKATKTHLLADFEDVARTYQSEAYKACVVMCGAVMEGLLLGNLERAKNIKLLWDAGRLTSFKTYNKVRNKLREASLEDLINHTRKSNCVDGFTDEIAKMVQRCRNSIHPGRVLRGDETFDAFDKKVAELALSFLNLLCSLMAKS